MKKILIIILLCLLVGGGFIGYQVYDRITQVVDLIRAGDAFQQSGDYQSAITAYEKANEVVPTAQATERLKQAQQRLKAKQVAQRKARAQQDVAAAEKAKGFEVQTPVGDVRALEYAPNGQQLVFANGGNLYIWDILKRKVIRKIEAHEEDIRDIAYAADGEVIASAAGQTIKLWNPANGNNRLSFQTNEDIWKLVISPNGETLFTAGRNISAWQAASGQKLRVFMENATKALETLALSLDGGILAAYDPDENGIQVWDAYSGENIANFRIKDRSLGITSIAFIPQYQRIVGVSRQSGYIWQYPGGEQLAQIDARYGNAVTVSPEGRLIAGASWKGNDKSEEFAWIYDRETENLQFIAVEVNAPFYHITFSPDGQWLTACGRQPNLLTWRISDLPLE